MTKLLTGLISNDLEEWARIRATKGRLPITYVLIVFLFLCLPFSHRASAASNKEQVLVAAASDLRFALTEIAARFTSERAINVKLSFGSSGNLARQIMQGAPFDIFLSADEAYIKRLDDAGLTKGTGLLYAVGRIGLLSIRGSSLNGLRSLEQLAGPVKNNAIKSFAIANPKHAPYGRAAKQCLQYYGLWTAMKPYLIIGENASQATIFSLSKAVDGGIVPHSLAAAPAIASKGDFMLLPQACHKPMRQSMVLLASANEAARKFYKFLHSETARTLLKKHHFELPED